MAESVKVSMEVAFKRNIAGVWRKLNEIGAELHYGSHVFFVCEVAVLGVKVFVLISAPARIEPDETPSHARLITELREHAPQIFVSGCAG